MVAPRVLTPGKLAKLLDVCPKTICNWIDAGKIAADPLPGSKHRRVRIEDALAFVRQEGKHAPELEALAVRCGVQVLACPTVILYTTCVSWVPQFNHEGFHVVYQDDPFFLGMELFRQRYDAVIVDQALGSAEVARRLKWLDINVSQTRTVIVANEDDEVGSAGWRADDYWRRPVDGTAIAKHLYGRLRAGVTHRRAA